MSMNFERFKTQLECEKIVGCTNVDQWNNYRVQFEAITLSAEKVSLLTSTLADDAINLYFKGLLSICEAISSINKRLYSWSVVKAYYSVFYFLRCSLALNGYAIIRNKSLYLFKIKDGEQPGKKTSDKYRNDHVCVINVYCDLYSSSDILQSNTIDGKVPYSWMMNCRNQINYRQREFYDPEPPEFLKVIAAMVDSIGIDQLITEYIDDPKFLYCFQEDHACLALPIKRFLLTKNDIIKAIGSFVLPSNKHRLLSSLLVGNSEPLTRANFFLK